MALAHASNVMVWGTADTGHAPDYSLARGLNDYVASSALLPPSAHRDSSFPDAGSDVMLQRLSREVECPRVCA